jgi:hypothetical protein
MPFSLFFLPSVNRMQGKDRGVKTTEGCKAIHSRSAEMICVYSLMKNESDSEKEITATQYKHVLLKLLVCT